MGDWLEVFPSSESENRTFARRVTGSPLPDFLYGQTVQAYLGDELISTDSSEAGSTDILINATAHAARIGDRIVFTSGAVSGRFSSVIETTTNSLTLGQRMPSSIGTGITFQIRRAALLSLTGGGISASVTPVYSTSDAAGDGFLVGGEAVSSGRWTRFATDKVGANFTSSANGVVTNSMMYFLNGSTARPVSSSNKTNPVFELPSIASTTTTTLGVTTASQTALAANSARSFAFFQNDSDTTIYIKLGSAAVVSTGIRLNANGGSYQIDSTNMYTGIVTAIHAGTGTKTLLITSG